MIYKVRVYTREIKSSFVYAVEAPNANDATEAAKRRVKTLGFTVKRAYANFELDGYIDAYNE